MTVGKENLVFESGPFSHFGSQALTCVNLMMMGKNVRFPFYFSLITDYLSKSLLNFDLIYCMFFTYGRRIDFISQSIISR